MKEGLEANHMKRHWEDMINMRECMGANHEKMMREEVKRARDRIFNNGSAGGTNDTFPDLSMPSPTSELFDEKKTGMTGIECEDKNREGETMKRDM